MAAPWSPAAVRVILLGRPGSGKGTQGVGLAARPDVPYLAVGDLLRAEVTAHTPIGRAVARHLEAGALAPDTLVLRTLARRLAAADRPIPEVTEAVHAAVEPDLPEAVPLTFGSGTSR